MKKEFTASTYILENQKVLLIYHVKLQKWLPPGGHVEADETPAEAARREVKEETGLEIAFLLQENVWIKEDNAKSTERPYLCLVENIPPYQQTPAHQHMDFVYLARPLSSLPEETEHLCQWFSWADLQQLKPEIEIFNETLQVIQHLLSTFCKHQLEASSVLSL